MTVPVAVTAALAAAVVWLVIVPSGRPIPGRSPSGRPGTGRSLTGPGATRRWPVPTMAGVGVVIAASAILDGHELALALVLVGAAAALLRMWRRSRRVREVAQRRARVVEVGESLVGELAAGVPPVTALGRGAQLWPELRPVAAAAKLDADVPDALRALAALPGAEGLADLASAWQVSQRSGGTLAGALAQVVESARARQAAAHLVRSELASAQATARLVAVLPLGTLAMAAGVGAAPWSFLLRSTAGLVCLTAGLALIFAGLAWIDRIATTTAGS